MSIIYVEYSSNWNGRRLGHIGLNVEVFATTGEAFCVDVNVDDDVSLALANCEDVIRVLINIKDNTIIIA